MRFLISFILCCAVLLMKCEPIQGQLIKDFFNGIHKTADKVRNDIRKVIRPESKNVKTADNTAIIFFDDDDRDSKPFQFTTNKPQYSTIPTQVTTNKQDPFDNNSGFVFGNEDTRNVRTDTITSSTTGKPGNTEAITFVTEKVPDTTSNNSTDSGGKENFSGGCLPGYQRSPDGRCMPTFK